MFQAQTESTKVHKQFLKMSVSTCHVIDTLPASGQHRRLRSFLAACAYDQLSATPKHRDIQCRRNMPTVTGWISQVTF